MREKNSTAATNVRDGTRPARGIRYGALGPLCLDETIRQHSASSIISVRANLDCDGRQSKRFEYIE